MLHPLLAEHICQDWCLNEQIFIDFLQLTFKTSTENLLRHKIWNHPLTCFPSVTPPQTPEIKILPQFQSTHLVDHSSVAHSNNFRENHTASTCQQFLKLKKNKWPINHCCYFCNNEIFAAALWYCDRSRYLSWFELFKKYQPEMSTKEAGSWHPHLWSDCFLSLFWMRLNRVPINHFCSLKFPALTCRFFQLRPYPFLPDVTLSVGSQ